MNSFRKKKFGFAAFALAVGLAILPMPATRISASDHIDSPIITQDRGSDLTDTYAFLDPNDNSKVVLIMSMPGQFLVKDIMLLGAAVWTAGEALRASDTTRLPIRNDG